MALDTKQYLEQLAQSTDLADEDKAALLKVAANEKFAKVLGDSVLRQEDYSRNMDALKADRSKWEKFYSDLTVWKATEEARIAQVLGNNGQPEVVQQVQPSDFITPKQFQEEMNRREQVQIALLKDGMRLASQHAVEFKEPLDSDALAKLAVEKNLSLVQAYNEMVSPRRAESQKTQYDNQLKQAREEGARDALAKHRLPVDTQPREYHVLADRDPSKMAGAADYQPNSGKLSISGERALREGFVEEWQKAGSTSGT
jgi:hypothetical protein